MHGCHPTNGYQVFGAGGWSLPPDDAKKLPVKGTVHLKLKARRLHPCVTHWPCSWVDLHRDGGGERHYAHDNLGAAGGAGAGTEEADGLEDDELSGGNKAGDFSKCFKRHRHPLLATATRYFY